jgi:hypothetical protein
MTSVSRVTALAAAAAIFILPIAAPADTRARPLNENAALNLLEHTLKRDHVYDKRISWDCISYDTEETTNAYFEFAFREIHNAKCGGDPVMGHVIDRYRVYRRSGKIQQFEAAEDKWLPYRPPAD